MMSPDDMSRIIGGRWNEKRHWRIVYGAVLIVAAAALWAAIGIILSLD